MGNNEQHIAHVYNDIGIIYRKQGKYEESLQYFHKSLNIYQELKIDEKDFMTGNIYNYIKI